MDGWQSIFQNFIIAIDPAAQDPQHWLPRIPLKIFSEVS